MTTLDRFRAGKRLWSEADDAELRRVYPNEPNTAIAQRLRRTVFAIYARADKLGLKKSAAYLAGPHACRLRRGDNVGARFRFPKGHVPANKGLRRPEFAAGRMKETQFKPGTPSWRNMPIDSTRMIDGYLYRKVSDVPKVPYTINWKPEHVLIWSQTRGPVPAGHVVIFKNGDRTDLRLENFECITRRALMGRNSVHNLPEPLAQTVQLLGALNRQIRRRSQHEVPAQH